jgi:Fe-S cluster assembly iron-binding protein IscA
VLTLSDTALELISQLVARDRDRFAGLRISAAGSVPGLRMSLAAGPGPYDLVLSDPRGRVFLDPVAVTRLARERLGARRDARGCAFFLEPARR